MPDSLRLLLVDDDPTERLLLERQLEGSDEVGELIHCVRLSAALEILERESVDLVLLDLGLPDSQGFETFTRFRKKFPRIPAIVLTGLDDKELARQALRGHAQDYLVKGEVEGESLIRAVCHAVERAAAEGKVRTALRVCADGILVLDAHRRVVFANDAAGDLFGSHSEDLMGLEFEIPELSLADQEWTLDCGRILETRTQNVDWDGRAAHLYSFRDITERRNTEQQLEQAKERALEGQKLEALGLLAGGIAHDFNNTLMGIMGHAEMLALGGTDEEVSESAEIILSASRRAANLTKQLLGFARKGKYRHLPVDLHEAIDETVALVSRTLDATVEVHRRLDATSSVVKADPDQISQVLLNLAINARDAMPSGGHLTFQTRDEESSVVVIVSDTGCGIESCQMDKVFEPFYTTKPTGKGTGMGLAMVYGVVKNHGGSIAIRSRPEEGCVVELRLPAAPMAKTTNFRENSDSNLGAGFALVIDDESFVEHTLRKQLSHLGFDATTCGSAKAGLEYFAAHHQSLQFVLLDLRMPGMGGADCLPRLRAINSKVPVIVITGYGPSSPSPDVEGWLCKPFTLDELETAVYQAITRGI